MLCYYQRIKITEIYCLADDFCKFYSETVKNNALEEPDGKRHRNNLNRLSNAEAITILVAFHMGGHCCLKHFYPEFVCRHRRMLLLPKETFHLC